MTRRFQFRRQKVALWFLIGLAPIGLAADAVLIGRKQGAATGILAFVTTSLVVGAMLGTLALWQRLRRKKKTTPQE